MKIIEEYKVLSAKSSGELTTVVKALMTDGWNPVGSHQVATKFMHKENANRLHRYTLEYTQTLIR